MFYNYTAPVLLGQIDFGSGLAEQPPILNIASTGKNIVDLSCTNGFPGDMCYLLSSTNLAAGPRGWTFASTNTFDKTGSISLFYSFPANSPPIFYRLQLQ
jgi:hypothetical protein